MATVIRFSRHGSKKRPFYRIVVQNSQAPRDGKFIEHIGHYDPVKGMSSLKVENERLNYWLGVGAQMSDSVRTCLRTGLAAPSATTVSSDKAAPQETAPADDKAVAAPVTSKKKSGKSKEA